MDTGTRTDVASSVIAARNGIMSITAAKKWSKSYSSVTDSRTVLLTVPYMDIKNIHFPEGAYFASIRRRTIPNRPNYGSERGEYDFGGRAPNFLRKNVSMFLLNDKYVPVSDVIKRIENGKNVTS